MHWADIVVIGGAGTDYLVRGPRLPGPGESLEGLGFQEGPGGRGVTRAIAASRLGARVALITCIGVDERGDRILSNLEAEGVSVVFVARDPEAPTGAALVSVSSEGISTCFSAPGANVHLSDPDVISAAEVIQNARVVLAQLDVPIEPVRTALELARAAGVHTILDPGPSNCPQDVWSLLPMVDVFRCDTRQAETLTGIRATDESTRRQVATRLIRRGVDGVVLRVGTDGNLLVWSRGERWTPTLPVRSVDQTGADDAFVAALAVTMAERRHFADAGPLAAAAAALTATKLGAHAGLPTREEVLALLN